MHPSVKSCVESPLTVHYSQDEKKKKQIEQVN